MIYRARDEAQLLGVVTTNVVTIPDVVRVMRAIDALLREEDGLKWFNCLYLLVTEAVQMESKAVHWQSPEWLERLVVEFAKLYFEAVANWLTNPAATPAAWAALLAARFNPGVTRVQFALAGMNAHINVDLPVAVVRACALTGCAPCPGSAEEADYVRINHILNQVETRAMQQLATGAIQWVSERVNPLDRWIAMWFVNHARAVAWHHARLMWRFNRPRSRRVDRWAGQLGARILTPLRI